MGLIRQSVSWWCVANGALDPESLVRAIKDIGYDAIELVDREYWPLVKKHGLTIAAIEGHRSIEDGLNRRENLDRIESEIRSNIDLAVRWKIPNLVVFSGNRDGLDDATGATNTADGLRKLAPAAEAAGVTLVLELLNSKVDHPDYQCDRTRWGIEVCRMVASPRVKLLYDIYHMQIMEGDIMRTIAAHQAYFGHYHTAGNPGRHELNETQELQYGPIVRTIAATGYDGYIGHEFIPVGDPIAALADAFNLCNVM